jgi:hypothetical protein
MKKKEGGQAEIKKSRLVDTPAVVFVRLLQRGGESESGGDLRPTDPAQPVEPSPLSP